MRIEENSLHPPSSILHPVVLLIQDAHTNNSGQLNEAKLLDILYSQKKDLSKYIFLEAGSGNESLSFLRKYASLEKRQQVAKSFLLQAKLQGTEYLDLTSDHDMTLWGVEDMALYAKSVEIYRQISKTRDKFTDYLQRIENTIHQLEPGLLNPALFAFEQKYQKYLKQEISSSDYFQALSLHAQALKLSLKYPHFKIFINLQELERRIDFNQVTEEEKKVIASLPEAQRMELLKAGESKDEKVKRAFFSSLSDILQRYPKTYPNLEKYIAYFKASEDLNSKGLLEEQKALEGEIFKALTTTPDEDKILKASHHVQALKKLLLLQFTPDDYRAYRRDKLDFDIRSIAGFLNRKIMEGKDRYDQAIFLENGYDQTIQKCEEFYELTYQRDQAFISNMLEVIEGTKQHPAITNVQKGIAGGAGGEASAARNEELHEHSGVPQVTGPATPKRTLTPAAHQHILITGGYHTPNLKYLLKQKNISYISLTPQVLQETNTSRYEEMLLSQKIPTPLPTQSPAGKAGMLGLQRSRTNGTFTQLAARLAPNPEKEREILTVVAARLSADDELLEGDRRSKPLHNSPIDDIASKSVVPTVARSINWVNIPDNIRADVIKMLDDKEIIKTLELLPPGEPLNIIQSNRFTLHRLVEAVKPSEAGSSVSRGLVIRLDLDWASRDEQQNLRFLRHEIGCLAHVNSSALKKKDIAKVYSDLVSENLLQTIIFRAAYDSSAAQWLLANKLKRSAMGPILAYSDQVNILDKKDAHKPIRAGYYAYLHIYVLVLEEKVKKTEHDFTNDRKRWAEVLGLTEDDRTNIEAEVGKTLAPMVLKGGWTIANTFHWNTRSFILEIEKMYGKANKSDVPAVTGSNTNAPVAAVSIADVTIVDGSIRWVGIPDNIKAQVEQMLGKGEIKNAFATLKSGETLYFVQSGGSFTQRLEGDGNDELPAGLEGNVLRGFVIGLGRGPDWESRSPAQNQNLLQFEMGALAFLSSEALDMNDILSKYSDLEPNSIAADIFWTAYRCSAAQWLIENKLPQSAESILYSVLDSVENPGKMEAYKLVDKSVRAVYYASWHIYVRALEANGLKGDFNDFRNRLATGLTLTVEERESIELAIGRAVAPMVLEGSWKDKKKGKKKGKNALIGNVNYFSDEIDERFGTARNPKVPLMDRKRTVVPQEVRRFRKFVKIPLYIHQQVEEMLEDDEISRMLGTLGPDVTIYFVRSDDAFLIQRLNGDGTDRMPEKRKGRISRGFVIRLDLDWGLRSYEQNKRLLQFEIGALAFLNSGALTMEDTRFKYSRLTSDSIVADIRSAAYSYSVVKWLIEHNLPNSARSVFSIIEDRVKLQGEKGADILRILQRLKSKRLPKSAEIAFIENFEKIKEKSNTEAYKKVNKSILAVYYACLYIYVLALEKQDLTDSRTTTVKDISSERVKKTKKFKETAKQTASEIMEKYRMDLAEALTLTEGESMNIEGLIEGLLEPMVLDGSWRDKATFGKNIERFRSEIEKLFRPKPKRRFGLFGARLANRAPNFENNMSSPEPLEIFFAGVAFANQNRFLSGDSTPQFVPIQLGDDATSIFTLRLIRDGQQLLLEVSQEGLASVYIDVREVIADSKGKPQAAVVSTSDLVNLVTMNDETIRNLLESVPGIDFAKPVLTHAHLGIFGDLTKDHTYFDLFVMQIYSAQRKKSPLMQNTSFSFEGSKEELALAVTRLEALEKEHGLEGKLSSLFVENKDTLVSHVNLVPANVAIQRQPGHRYVPMMVPDRGAVFSYLAAARLSSIVGRITISADSSIDTNVLTVFRILSGTLVESVVLKLILDGLADVSILMKHALRALAHVGLQAMYQWAKNMLSIACWA